MLTKEQIIRNRSFIDKKPIMGVYFLIKNQDIVYIGSSTDIEYDYFK